MNLKEIGWEDASGTGEVSVAGTCEHGNDEPSGSIKGGEFID
jgi:hypothetical protein